MTITTETYRTTTLCGIACQVEVTRGGRIPVMALSSALTPCCQTATERHGAATLCRGCGEERSDAYTGIGAAAITRAVSEHGCPCPEGCADEAMYHLRMLVDDDTALWDYEAAAALRAVI